MPANLFSNPLCNCCTYRNFELAGSTHKIKLTAIMKCNAEMRFLFNQNKA